MIKDDDMLKKQLWTLTQEVAKHIYAEKAGLQINVLPLLKQHIKRYSPGYYFHLGHLMKGGGTLALYLDRFSGLPQPCFWYGLYTESPPRHRAFESVARSMVPGRPLRLGDKDYAADPYERLKVPLSAFERLLIECYLKDGAYYCGLYSPYSVPLSNANRRSLASEASHFLSECARRLLGLYEPGPGKKATMRGPASKRSEQAAIRFMRKMLEASKPTYRVISRQRNVCGYDLLATRQREPKETPRGGKGSWRRGTQILPVDDRIQYRAQRPLLETSRRDSGDFANETNTSVDDIAGDDRALHPTAHPMGRPTEGGEVIGAADPNGRGVRRRSAEPALAKSPAR